MLRDCFIPAPLRFVLRTSVRKSLFVLTVTVPGIAFLAVTVWTAVVQMEGESGEAERIRRAITVDAQNARPHYALGMVLSSGTSGGITEALQELKTAVALNPNSSVYWSGLGNACFVAGDAVCAERSFRRATEIAPMRPQFAWQAAVNLIASGRTVEAIAELKRFIRLKPDGAPDAFLMLLRTGVEPHIVWRELVRPLAVPEITMKYLDCLALQGSRNQAQQIWLEIADSNTQIPASAARPYLERVLSMDSYQHAREVWEYLLRTGAITAQAEDHSLVFNGGFEQDPIEMGFDWRVHRQPGVLIETAEDATQSGHWSMRTEFTLPQNREFELIHQFVPVLPMHRYLLTAFMRSEGITSNSGPRLRVVDAQCRTCPETWSEGATGTTDWHRVSVSFTASPITEVVRVSLWRTRSRSFPMEISGRFWLDSVVLGDITNTSAVQ